MKKITQNQKELIALAEATIKKEQLKSLTQSAKIVLGDIILLSGTDFAKNNGYCYRTNLDLVKDCELDEKTIIKSVRLLEANNIISSKRGIRGKASEYSVNSSMSSEMSSMSSEMSSKSLIEIKNYIDMKFNELRQYIDKCVMRMSSEMSSIMSSETQSMSSTDTDTESDKDIDKDSYIVNSIESITDKKENKNDINNTLIMVKESEGKTVEMENNNEIISNFSFVEDESTVNEIDGNVSTEIESTITPNNIVGIAAVQQPQKLSNIYFSFSRDGEDNSISSTNDGEDNIISMGDNNNDSMTSTEVQEERDSNETSITSTIDNKNEIGNYPQNLLDENSPKKSTPHFLPNETKDDEKFKRSIYQRLIYDPSQTNEQIENLYNDIVTLRDSNKVPKNEMDLIVYGFNDKIKYISALRDKCKL